MLIAVTSADSTRPRQLINGLAAQQSCRIWHPRIAGVCLPRCLQEEVEDGEMENGMSNGEMENHVNSSRLLRPSLAFLHVQSEDDREFGEWA